MGALYLRLHDCLCSLIHLNGDRVRLVTLARQFGYGHVTPELLAYVAAGDVLDATILNGCGVDCE